MPKHRQKRAVKNAPSAFDRRRPGHGDNVAFTTHAGAGGLGVGKRLASITTPSLGALHQFTNRTARTEKNGKGKKTI